MIHLAPLAPVPLLLKLLNGTFNALDFNLLKVTSPILLELDNDNFEAFRTQEILTRQGYHLKRQQVPSCREESIQSIHFFVNLLKF